MIQRKLDLVESDKKKRQLPLENRRVYGYEKTENKKSIGKRWTHEQDRVGILEGHIEWLSEIIKYGKIFLFLCFEINKCTVRSG